jgi:PAS domain S-box-containing protein
MFDELPVGMAWLSADGGVLSANAAAQQLLDGPSGSIVAQAAVQLCQRASAPGTLVEQVLSLGSLGEIRLVLSHGADGFLLCVERSGMARLRAEIGVLRSMLSATSESLAPALATRRVLTTLSSSLANSAVSVYSVEGTQPPVLLDQINVPPAQQQRAATSRDPLQSAVARALAFNQPVHVPCLARSPFAADRLVPGAEGLVSIVIPIRSGETVLGAIDLCGPQNVLGEAELRLVQGLADVVAVLLDRARREAVIEAERLARQAALNALDDAVLEMEAGGRIVFAAGRANAIFGCSGAELVGHTLDSWLGARDRERLRTLTRTAKEVGQASGEIEIAAPGGVVPCVVSIGIHGSGHNAVMRAVLRDVSARLALQAEVRRATEVAAKQDHYARVGRLAAGVAHEINNPLSFVKMNLVELRRGLEEQAAGTNEGGDHLSRDEMASMAAEAEEGVGRIAQIVRALSGFARGRNEDEVVFDPLRTVKDVARIFEIPLGGAVHVAVESAALPSVYGSPSALGQIVLNLLTNAQAAMDERGTIHVRGEAIDGCVRLSITDTGHGIAPQDREYVFDPFFTTREFGKGTGLGLYICRQLATQLHGTIEFQTGPQGTTFVVSLPEAGSSAQPRPALRRPVATEMKQAV